MAAVDREITLGHIGRALWRGKWIILVTTVVAAVIGLLLTFVTETTYTATARVFLGQATTTGGLPVSTPGTNPLTAPTTLRSDEILARVARDAGVPTGRVRDAVSIAVPRAPGAAATGQPSVATITVEDPDRAVARRIANSYADVVLQESNRGYRDVQEVYRVRLERLRAEQVRYERLVRRYSGLLVGATGPEATAYQSLLFAAQDRLAGIRDDIDAQELAIARSDQIEAPQVISLSEDPTSSTSAPNRARTVLIAALIGFLVGVIVALVWQGGAPRRAAPEG